MNFGRNFPSSLLRWQHGLGTAWPGREPEVKRPERGRGAGRQETTLLCGPALTFNGRGGRSVVFLSSEICPSFLEKLFIYLFISLLHRTSQRKAIIKGEGELDVWSWLCMYYCECKGLGGIGIGAYTAGNGAVTAGYYWPRVRQCKT